MKGVLIFQNTNLPKKLCIRFTPYDYSFLFTNIFCKGVFTTLFLFLKNSRNGKNTSGVILVSEKLWEYNPRFINMFLVIFVSQNPAWI
jgi:hypothetical protein